MDIKEAEGKIEGLNKQIAEQEKATGAFSDIIGALYEEKKGAITAANTTLQKIDGVDASYAMQLAVGLKEMLEKKIPGFYKIISKFTPKGVREALRTIIAYRVELPSIIAKDAYNARVKTYKFKQEASAALSAYKSVLGGI
jgi:hypothetical protein